MRHSQLLLKGFAVYNYSVIPPPKAIEPRLQSPHYLDSQWRQRCWRHHSDPIPVQLMPPFVDRPSPRRMPHQQKFWQSADSSMICSISTSQPLASPTSGIAVFSIPQVCVSFLRVDSSLPLISASPKSDEAVFVSSLWTLSTSSSFSQKYHHHPQ